MAIHAQDSADRVEQLIVLTERLTALCAHTAQAFEGQRPQDAAQHMEETAQLANIYRHESARIRAQPDLIVGAPQARRLALRRATEAFDAVIARQGRAIEAAKSVTEGLVKAIAEEVAHQRNRATTYGPGAETSPAAAAKAITLNRTA